MILDFLANFSGNTPVSIVGAAGTYLAPNTYDTGPLGTYFTANSASDTQLSPNVNAGRDLGGGENFWWVIEIPTAAAGGTSANFQLVTQSSSALGSPTVVDQTGAVLIASLGAKTIIKRRIPRSALWAQYVGVQAVTVGTMTTGTFLAQIAKDVDNEIPGYVGGFTVK